MELTIHVSDETGRGAGDLYQWLLRDRDQLLGIRLDATPDRADPSGMGLDVATINALVANAIALGSLIMAIATWRDARRKTAEPEPEVTITWADGSVTITGDDPEQLRAITQAVLDAVTTPSAVGQGTGTS